MRTRIFVLFVSTLVGCTMVSKKEELSKRRVSSLSYGQLKRDDVITLMQKVRQVTTLEEAREAIPLLHRSADLLVENWNTSLANESARIIDTLMVLDSKETYYLVAVPMTTLFLSERKDDFIDAVKRYIEDDRTETVFLQLVEQCVREALEGNG